jgi:hypothetical protein
MSAQVNSPADDLREQFDLLDARIEGTEPGRDRDDLMLLAAAIAEEIRRIDRPTVTQEESSS